jgi:hypothetical protein
MIFVPKLRVTPWLIFFVFQTNHCFVIYKISVTCCVPRFVRGMDGELKFASFYLSR